MSPADGSTVSTELVTVLGLGAADATVTQDINLAPDQHTVSDANGHWTLEVKLQSGANHLKFRIGDDESTAIGLTLTFAVQTPGATAVAVSSPQPSTPVTPPSSTKPAPTPKPTSIPTARPPKRVVIAKLIGATNKRGATFTLTGADARLVYTVKGGSYASVSFYVVAKGDSLASDGGFPEADAGAGSDSTMLAQEPGAYYLDVLSANATWTVRIEEYR